MFLAAELSSADFVFAHRSDGDETSAEGFAEGEMQNRDYRQEGYTTIGDHKIAELVEGPLSAIQDCIRSFYNRRDLWTDAKQRHYEMFIRPLVGEKNETPQDPPFICGILGI